MPFSPEEIEQREIEIRASESEKAANRYKFARSEAYPAIGEQLDMLWHDMNDGRVEGKSSSLWFASLKSVKDSNPKPQS